MENQTRKEIGDEEFEAWPIFKMKCDISFFKGGVTPVYMTFRWWSISDAISSLPIDHPLKPKVTVGRKWFIHTWNYTNAKAPIIEWTIIEHVTMRNKFPNYFFFFFWGHSVPISRNFIVATISPPPSDFPIRRFAEEQQQQTMRNNAKKKEKIATCWLCAMARKLIALREERMDFYRI